MNLFPAFAASLFLGLGFLVDGGLQDFVSTVCEITPIAHVALENGN